MYDVQKNQLQVHGCRCQVKWEIYLKETIIFKL